MKVKYMKETLYKYEIEESFNDFIYKKLKEAEKYSETSNVRYTEDEIDQKILDIIRGK
nr:hypothetical protein [Macrococcus goetzii]